MYATFVTPSVTPGNKKPSFKTVEIFNFTEADCLEIKARPYEDGNAPGFVCIAQYAGSLRLQFDMTPERARQMAAALIAAADYLEANEEPAA